MGTFRKLIFIIHPRRLKVSWGVSCEQGIVYNANGIRTEISVKMILGTGWFHNFVRKRWGITINWGWLRLFKSCDYVPISAPRQNSIYGNHILSLLTSKTYNF